MPRSGAIRLESSRVVAIGQVDVVIGGSREVRRLVDGVGVGVGVGGRMRLQDEAAGW